ncbi:hypothetical protein [Bradyrhizobium sp. Tv2a-2]|uniref:hypothetical protein n=1 Tax=Bradyrhizobium sp. Tv2a-2 TaxID=113395 RepID=UPI00040B51F0|nr:hypothetical protein [Bradyrhizobium sp. Tv2a-2]
MRNLAVALTALTLLLPGSALAQGKKIAAAPAADTSTPTTPTKACPFPWDPMKLCGLLTGDPKTDFDRVLARIKAVSKDDLTYALAKANNVGSNGSKIRAQCIQAIIDAKTAFDGDDIKDATGAVMKRPDPALVTAIEDTAELVDGLSPQGALMTNCAGAAQLMQTNTLQAVNGIVTGATALVAKTAITGVP